MILFDKLHKMRVDMIKFLEIVNAALNGRTLRARDEVEDVGKG